MSAKAVATAATDLIAATVVTAAIVVTVVGDRDFTPRDVPSAVDVPELDAATLTGDDN